MTYELAINVEALRADIPVELAHGAHTWTSHTPEVRGEQEIAGYAQTLLKDFGALLAIAGTDDDKRRTLESEFARYRAGYKRRTLAYLAARGRCASAMITGPANFPVARQEKASRRADRRSTELLEYRTRALAAIRKVLQPELAPIALGDADADARLRDKIGKLEAKRDAMKAANTAIRKHAKASAAAQVQALVELGYSIDRARELLKPDFAGRIGFADYEIRNSGAELRRLQSRLQHVERTHAQAPTTLQGTLGRVEVAPAEDRIRLYFPGKPDANVRAELKRNGFRWAPSQGAWSAYNRHHSLVVARRLAGVEEGKAAS